MSAESKLIVSLAKRRCLERLAEARAKGRVEQENREFATQVVNRMKNEQRNMHFYHGLQRTLFERSLRTALEVHFKANLGDTEGFFTTDQIIMMVNEIGIHTEDQREILRLLSMVKFLGCKYITHEYWSFPRIEPPPPEYQSTSTSISIFDKP